MDRSLVERAQGSDRDAFAILAADAVDRLYRVAYRILRDPEDAHDATQQALLEAWRDLGSLREPDRWEAWTYRLVVHACYRAGRRKRRLGPVMAIMDGDHPVGPDAATGVADRDLLERAFRTLSHDQRAVVVLHHHVGLPLTEIADLLGIPAGTARSRLHSAIHRLRAVLDADGRVAGAREGRTA